jgi:hypothetical protein
MRFAVENSKNPPSIQDCLEKKLDACKRFYSATVAIKKNIDAGDVDQIDRIIQERQKSMDIVDRIDDCLLEIKRDKHPHASPLNEETGAQIKQVLAEISALDRECHVAAVSRLAALQQEALQAIRTRNDVQRYPDTAPHMSRFLDMKL